MKRAQLCSYWRVVSPHELEIQIPGADDLVYQVDLLQQGRDSWICLLEEKRWVNPEILAEFETCAAAMEATLPPLHHRQ